ncbi:hypothetical protein PRIPAC_77030 [Pristionchus pacificus]|uniref:Uncharacterized protein n=1 Tax=Pristionchus pacificus TaxID=54126 RepID=A0A2A6BX87_PRIPA|nr:hypothetical protein PRIPAC_77030 [Pristionchus pacificus]|eukprot:PDM70467.1 hypothetical protein PRIPAC_46713 [Pristionchus pacificus]
MTSNKCVLSLHNAHMHSVNSDSGYLTICMESTDGTSSIVHLKDDLRPVGVEHAKQIRGVSPDTNTSLDEADGAYACGQLAELSSIRAAKENNLLTYAYLGDQLLGTENIASSNAPAKIAFATAIGFAIMGFIGFFVKLIHIPINNIIIGA